MFSKLRFCAGIKHLLLMSIDHLVYTTFLWDLSCIIQSFMEVLVLIMESRSSQSAQECELVFNTRRTKCDVTQRWDNWDVDGTRCLKLFPGKWREWRSNLQDLTILGTVTLVKCGDGLVSATWQTRKLKGSCSCVTSPSKWRQINSRTFERPWATLMSCVVAMQSRIGRV